VSAGNIFITEWIFLSDTSHASFPCTPLALCSSDEKWLIPAGEIREDYSNCAGPDFQSQKLILFSPFVTHFHCCVCYSHRFAKRHLDRVAEWLSHSIFQNTADI